MHDYVPDFIVRMKTEPTVHLILETKGYDPLEEVKRAAAERWVAAVNADGTYGQWRYKLLKRVTDIDAALASVEPEQTTMFESAISVTPKAAETSPRFGE
jgi:type III restriction enzyme